jgi:hypothetical protein
MRSGVMPVAARTRSISGSAMARVMAMMSADAMTSGPPSSSSNAKAETFNSEIFPFAGSVRAAKPASQHGSSGVITREAVPAFQAMRLHRGPSAVDGDYRPVT